jgi:hypothetical protein
MKRAVEDAEWKDWLDKRNAEYISECPELKRLQDKLLSIDGDIVCLQKEPDLETILSRGIVTEGKVVLKKMAMSRCHSNVAALWSKYEPKVKIVTGWGLSADGIWRQHTWALRGKTILETTEPRTKYFGVILTPEEADQFWEDNW